MDKEQEEAKMLQVADPAQREETYVHQVYNDIAAHFSQTRYKPWPIVEDFLKTRTSGSIGLDIGCGNGKYLGINNSVYIIGSDHSENLVRLAFDNNAKKQHFSDTVVADGLLLPHFNNSFDFVISIAVIHHFSNKERRVQAVKHILSKLNGNGQALIYVWALEQQNSRRGWKEGMPQDVLVPWVLQKKGKKKDKKGNRSKKVNNEEREDQKEDQKEEEEEEEAPETKMRYYHLYKKGELENDAMAAGGKVVRSGYERDNWWAVISREQD